MAPVTFSPICVRQTQRIVSVTFCLKDMCIFFHFRGPCFFDNAHFFLSSKLMFPVCGLDIRIIRPLSPSTASLPDKLQ